jgi:putative nucleotidyltransferase with HDIG domain
MIKKIHVTELRPGMFVHDLNCSWPQHSFLSYRFPVRSVRDIERIVELGVREIYIDTELGEEPAPSTSLPADAGEPQTVAPGVELATAPERVPLKSELAKAKTIYRQALMLVDSLMRSARFGKQVELKQVRSIVTAIVGSILRNPDAMFHAVRVKQADRYTFQHSVATATLLIAYCREMNLDRELMEAVGMGGLLHDIGKQKIPLTILNKPAKLDDQELAMMRRHVEFSCDLLEASRSLSPVAMDVVAQHHERFDGSGYPLQLRGEEISVYGQMAAIVDVYDAVTSDRSYHPAKEPSATLRQLLEASNRQFAPELPSYFIRTIGIYPVGSLVRLESGLLAVVVEQSPGQLLRPRLKAVFDTRAGRPIVPTDIDLSNPGVSDRILNIELPMTWNIDVNRFL